MDGDGKAANKSSGKKLSAAASEFVPSPIKTPSSHVVAKLHPQVASPQYLSEYIYPQGYCRPGVYPLQMGYSPYSPHNFSYYRQSNFPVPPQGAIMAGTGTVSAALLAKVREINSLKQQLKIVEDEAAKEKRELNQIVHGLVDETDRLTALNQKDCPATSEVTIPNDMICPITV